MPGLPVGTLVRPSTSGLGSTVPNVQNEFNFDQNPYQSSSRLGNARPSKHRKRTGDDSINFMLGLIASLVLFLGVFAPFLKVPIIGSLNYFQNGKGDGVIILALAAISLVLTLARQYVWLWFSGVGSLAVLGFTFVCFHIRMAELKNETKNDLAGNPFASIGEAMIDAVSFDWGFAVLIIGAGLLIASAASPLREK